LEDDYLLKVVDEYV